MGLQRVGGMFQCVSRVRLWRNWQTRYFEVVVGQPVQVQILLGAPPPVKSQKTQCLRAFPMCLTGNFAAGERE